MTRNDSGRLRMTPNVSVWLWMTPDDSECFRTTWTPDESGWLRMYLEDSGWIWTTPTPNNSGWLRKASNNSKRLQVMLHSPIESFRNFLCRIGIDSGFVSILPITRLKTLFANFLAAFYERYSKKKNKCWQMWHNVMKWRCHVLTTSSFKLA